MPYENEYLDDLHGVLWLQPDGPNTKPEYLGCHDLTGPTVPGGAITRALCVSPTNSGRFNTSGVSQGPPGAPTVTVATRVGKTADYLEDMLCPGSLYLMQQLCDDNRNSLLHFVRGEVYQYLRRTNTAMSNMARGRFAPGDTPEFAEQSHDYEMDRRAIFYDITPDRLETAETENLNDITGITDFRCQGPCGEVRDKCDVLYAVANAGVGAANVLESMDGGNTWAATAADPFAAGEDIASIVWIPIGEDNYRLIVACGSAAAGAAQIAWSDDQGATPWNVVTMGAATDYFMWNGSLFAWDYYHIWAVTDQGDIFFSSDGGVTWTEQAPGTTTNSLYYIKFCDAYYGLACGIAGTILYTADGGAHWVVLTPPAAQAAVIARCCDILDASRFWVGWEDGELWYTFNGGPTMVSADWHERAVDTPSGHVATGRVSDIGHTDDHNLWFVCETDKTTPADGLGGSLHRTFDGGYNWQVWGFGPFDEQGGLHAVLPCSYDVAVAVGAPITTATIYRTVRAST